MPNHHTDLISFVIPLYNEAPGLEAFHASLLDVIAKADIKTYEIIYCDDGSTDNTGKLVQSLHDADSHVKLIKFSRNFGKESALTAGIAEAAGQAIITLDGDGQHPVELLPKFIESWMSGAQVVIGIRTSNSGEKSIKKSNSRWFYTVFNKLTGQKLIPGSTDFRLIDKAVQQAFLQLKESDRITRGLIDWLGFTRDYIYFDAKPRESGDSSYGTSKLMKLAADSFVSLTPTPLYVFGFFGIFITCGAFLLGSCVFLEQIILNDPLHWNFTGTAMLGILILFLVGIVLLSQGILSLYISHIHSQSKARPLYVIDYDKSAGVKKNNNA
jgi:glycosyltransferase involved in cell wall biosynthesis